MIIGAVLAHHFAVEGIQPLFITLTLADTKDGLCSAVTRLLKGFRDLRRWRLWEERVKGGIAIIEIKWSDKAMRWHPHLHIMAEGKYIDQGELSDAWRSITGDSYIVDIQRVTNLGEVVRYVTKYASKPMNTSFCGTPTLLDEAIVALRGKRLIVPFGKMYRTLSKLMEEQADACDDMRWDPEAWTLLGSWLDLANQAREGDGYARSILARLEVALQRGSHNDARTETG
jgi:hypothetical protein